MKKYMVLVVLFFSCVVFGFAQGEVKWETGEITEKERRAQIEKVMEEVGVTYMMQDYYAHIIKNHPRETFFKDYPLFAYITIPEKNCVFEVFAYRELANFVFIVREKTIDVVMFCSEEYEGFEPCDERKKREFEKWFRSIL